MTSVGGSPHALYTESVQTLAGRVLDGLGAVQDTRPVRVHLDETPDAKAGYAAVRVLGPDVFVPQILAGIPFHPADTAVVQAAFEVFPPATADLPPEMGPEMGPEMAGVVLGWRDWATARLLRRYGGVDLGLACPAEGCALTDPRDWRAWSVRMAQLSPLALPGLHGPVHDAAEADPVALSRGLTRALLRRDYPTAARLARWLGMLRGNGTGTPLDPQIATEHLRLLGGGGARITLDLSVAEHLLETGSLEMRRE